MTEPQVISCEEALRRLLDHLDRELEADRDAEVAHHLQRCLSCYSRAEFERRLKRHLADAGRAAVRPSLEARIRALMAELPIP